MSPAEAIRYVRDRERQNFAGALQQLRYEQADNLDRARFDDQVRSNSLAARHASEVEALVRDERAAGRTVSRETALAYIVGRNALAGQGAAREAARRGAQDRIRRQTTRPGNAGSGEPPPRRDNDRDAYRKRLDGYKF